MTSGCLTFSAAMPPRSLRTREADPVKEGSGLDSPSRDKNRWSVTGKISGWTIHLLGHILTGNTLTKISSPGVACRVADARWGPSPRSVGMIRDWRRSSMTPSTPSDCATLYAHHPTEKKHQRLHLSPLEGTPRWNWPMLSRINQALDYLAIDEHITFNNHYSWPVHCRDPRAWDVPCSVFPPITLACLRIKLSRGFSHPLPSFILFRLIVRHQQTFFYSVTSHGKPAYIPLPKLTARKDHFCTRSTRHGSNQPAQAAHRADAASIASTPVAL